MIKSSMPASLYRPVCLSLLLLWGSNAALADSTAGQDVSVPDNAVSQEEVSDSVSKSFSLGLIAREKIRQLKAYLQTRKQQAARAAYELGVDAADKDDIDAAYQYVNEAIMLDPENVQYLQAGVELSFLQGDYDQAEALQLKAIDIVKMSETVDARQLSLLLDSLGTIYAAQELYDKAVTSFEESLAVREEGLGKCSLLVAVSLNKLATLAVRQEKSDRAEELLKRSLDVVNEVSGPDHPNTAAVKANLADLYQEDSRLEEAEVLYRDAIRIWTESPDDDPMRQVIGQNALGRLYLVQQRYDEAREQFEQVLALLERHYAPDHPYVTQAINNIGVLEEELGKQAQVDEVYDTLVREFNLHLHQRDSLTATIPSADTETTPQ